MSYEAGPAAATPSSSVVTLIGSAPATASGPGTVTFSYAVNTPDPLTAVTLQTHQDALLPALASPVTLDGTAIAAPNTVTPASPDIAVQLPTLAAGNHVITFAATTPSASAITSSTATLTFTDSAAPGATPLTSAPVTVAINEPDLTLHTIAASGLLSDTSTPATLRVGTLSDGFIEADVTNHGTTTPVTLLLNLPPDAVFGSAFTPDGNELICTANPTNAQHLSCPLGPIASGATAAGVFDVSTSANPPAGSSEPATVTAQVDGSGLTDSNLTDNATTTAISFIGAGHLSHTASTPPTKVTVGTTATIAVTVRNDGPQQAPNAVGLIALQNSDFSVVGFDGAQLPPDTLGTVGSSSGSTSSLSSGAGAASSPPAAVQSAAANASRLAALWPATRGHASTGRPAAQRQTVVRQSVLRQFATANASGSAASQTASTPSAAASSPGVVWNLGTLATGQSKTAHLTLKAIKPGAMQIAVLAFSDAGDPVCSNATSLQALVTAGCIQLLNLTATAAPLAVPHVAAAQPISPQLANTGAPTAVPTLLGVAMVLLGAFGVRIGRRRA